MDEINSVEDIQRLAVAGFDNWGEHGHVNVTERGDLLLFDYTTAAHIANRWNAFECMSRGLIINRRTGEIIARPFDKFFYWLSEGRRVRGHIVTVMEKLDGSLGILYRHKGEYHVTTKGSFFSPQARWATAHLREHYDLTDLGDEWTLLFEIIYPDNRIIVDYGTREELILLAARNRFTGEFMPFFPDLFNLAEQYGFILPHVYSFNSVDDIIAATALDDPNFEGWVVEFSDGQRFKFKIDRYVEIHKLIRGLDFPTIAKAIANNDINYILNTIPDDFLGDVKQWVTQIQGMVQDISDQTRMIYATAPTTSRAELEQWAETHHPRLAPYLLALYDGDDLTRVIIRYMMNEADKVNQ